MLFYLFQNKDSKTHQAEIIDADYGEDLGETKIFGGNGFPFSGQFYAGHNEGQ